MSDAMARKRELLRQRLAEQGLAATVETVEAPVRSDGDTTPLAVAQRRLWFVSYRDPADTSLTVPVALRVTGDLDEEKLHHAFEAVLARHETLRATYELGPDGEPVMRHRAGVSLPWTTHDLTDLDERARQRRLAVLARREFSTPFDLTADVPIRLTLIRTGAREHVLLLAAHHICVDDASWPVLFADVAAAYRGADLAPLGVQYADVAPAVETAIDADVAYWREHLSPLPDLPILPGAETTGSDRRRSDRVMREIPVGVAAAVASAASTQAATPFAAYLLAEEVHASGVLADGTPVEGPATLRKALMARPETAEVFASAFVQILVGQANIGSLPAASGGEVIPARESFASNFAGSRFGNKRYIVTDAGIGILQIGRAHV